MFVLALRVEMHFSACRSLKEKRAVIKPVIEGIRVRHHASVAETEFHDQWQRAAIGVAVVSATPGGAEEWMDQIERFVWSRPDIEVTSVRREWTDFES
ncbi:MAG: DUF503 domain-containing protein [Acidimicrobiales bacterium]|jgi:uncharacterized protein